MQERSMRAADLFRNRVISAEVARRLGVSHQVVSDWRKAWRHGGRAALRGKGRAGRRARLSTAQLAKVEKALARAPRPSIGIWRGHVSVGRRLSPGSTKGRRYPAVSSSVSR
ncbi:MAG: helix-turn-helix domain-containing protein [Chloroflexi bacterium]|nr:helix-turn-helix domain-containing protein [Chloroflexota bacterium]